MNCMENENVCSVKKENNLGYYRLHTIWKNDGFFLNITSRDGAWRGEMTPNDVKKMSNQLKIEPDSYLKQCKQALTCHDGQPGMVYSVENGGFTWKRIDDEDSGIKIKMGTVMVESASFVDTIQNLVNAALNCNKKLQKEINELQKENQNNLSKKNALLSKLEELINAKDVMENELYTRFLLLLNAKKKKIKELQDVLQIKNEKVGIAENVNPNQIESNKNPYEVDTDDDCDVKTDTKVRISRMCGKSKEKTLRKGSPAAIEYSEGKKPRRNFECSEEEETAQNLKSIEDTSKQSLSIMSKYEIVERSITNCSVDCNEITEPLSTWSTEDKDSSEQRLSCKSDTVEQNFSMQTTKDPNILFELEGCSKDKSDFSESHSSLKISKDKSVIVEQNSSPLILNKPDASQLGSRSLKGEKGAHKHSSSDQVLKDISDIPSTKDELLDYFFG